MLRIAPAKRSTRRGTPPEQLPAHIAPMLAVAGNLPAVVNDFAYEFKWDGMRAILFWDRKHLRIESRNLLNVTSQYPELHAITAAMATHSFILDGEIVALENSKPSFAQLQKRMHVSRPSSVLVQHVPVSLMVFDLLYLDGTSLLGVPWKERREALESIRLSEPAVVSPAITGQGAMLLETAQDLGLEGIVAKRIDSMYEPGRRSGAWLKIKLVHTTELVIGGYILEKSVRANRIGALLLGYYHGKDFVYAGSVGTGFNAAEHARLIPQLKRLEVTRSPFASDVPRSGVMFVMPNLVAAIEYRRWPDEGLIQQAAYKGLRIDKSAHEIVRDTVKA